MRNKTKKALIVLSVFLVVNVVNAFNGFDIAGNLIKLAINATFSSTYDIATPAGSDNPAEADDRMREIKAATQERLNVEHVFDLTGTEVSGANTGKHTDITCTSIANTGNASCVDIAASGNGTVGGTLGVTGAATVGGTLGVTGIATLGDGSVTATSAAPSTDAMVANKKYVDDQVAAVTLPSSLTGADESNGETTIGTMEMKWGQVTLSSSPQTHTFTGLTGIDSAFSNACFQVIACPGGPDAGAGGSGTRVYDVTTTGFKTASENYPNDTPMRFIAIGR
jgi:hypothetical protein